ncbi:MAG: nuclear transport factor 2 family protein [Proteobacteria bacterium]|nr:nuclear transport factor 2 family protein [Pseudomonadota bacterium]
MSLDLKELKAAHDKFFDATNQMFTGDLTLMKEIWSHSEDVIYMGPDGGYQVGWGEVLADWQRQADLKLGGKVVTTQVHLAVNGDLGYAHSIEVGQNDQADGENDLPPVQIRATKIFRKEEGAWRLISLHTDRLDYLHTDG